MELPAVMSSPSYLKKLQNYCKRHTITWEEVKIPWPEEGAEGHGFAFFPAGKERDKNPVLVFHGTGNDSLYGQVALLKSLLAEGFSVRTFDLDGHGRHSSTQLDVQRSAGSVTRLLRRMHEQGELESCYLVGYSLGGTLALHATVAMPELVKALVLIAVPNHLNFGLVNLIKEIPLVGRWAFWEQLAHYSPWELVPAIGPFKRKQFPIRHGAQSSSYLDAVTQLINGAGAPALARRIACPLLAIYGGKDSIAPVSHGREIVAGCEHGELVVIPQETHYSTLLARATVRGAAKWLKLKTRKTRDGSDECRI